jgi:hypothetical protein
MALINLIRPTSTSLRSVASDRFRATKLAHHILI